MKLLNLHYSISPENVHNKLPSRSSLFFKLEVSLINLQYHRKMLKIIYDICSIFNKLAVVSLQNL